MTTYLAAPDSRAIFAKPREATEEAPPKGTIAVNEASRSKFRVRRRRIEPWRLLHSIYSFSDRWLRLRSDTVRLPGGSTLTPYHVIEAADWVNVVAISEAGCIVLAVATADEVPGSSSWEVWSCKPFSFGSSHKKIVCAASMRWRPELESAACLLKFTRYLSRRFESLRTKESATGVPRMRK